MEVKLLILFNKSLEKNTLMEKQSIQNQFHFDIPETNIYKIVFKMMQFTAV